MKPGDLRRFRDGTFVAKEKHLNGVVLSSYLLIMGSFLSGMPPFSSMGNSMMTGITTSSKITRRQSMKILK